MCNHLRSPNMEKWHAIGKCKPHLGRKASMQAISKEPNQHGAERAALLDAIREVNPQTGSLASCREVLASNSGREETFILCHEHCSSAGDGVSET